MSKPPPDYDLEQRISTGLLDVLIRAGLIGVLAVLCYVVFAPFLTLMAWAVVLAVTLYPLHGWLARHIGGENGPAPAIIGVMSGVLVVRTTVLLVNSFGSSVHDLVYAVRHDTLEIPAPREAIRDWPIIGKKIHGLWSRAYTDLPGLIQSMQPKIGELAAKALAIVASIGVG